MCVVCTLLFGVLLFEICMLRVLGEQWRQRVHRAAVFLLDTYVIWNLTQGDVVGTLGSKSRV